MLFRSYLVAFDWVGFSSTPTDLSFSFAERVVTMDKMDPNCARLDIATLLKPFLIGRLFVPQEFVSAAREYVARKYTMN